MSVNRTTAATGVPNSCIYSKRIDENFYLQVLLYAASTFNVSHIHDTTQTALTDVPNSCKCSQQLGETAGKFICKFFYKEKMLLLLLRCDTSTT